MSNQTAFINIKVAAVFESYPQAVKAQLLLLRELIFSTASQTNGVGELEETLRWGQPSYLTSKSKSGSLIRIDQIKSQEGAYAMYFHCQTNLIDTFKERYRDTFKFAGNRGLIFHVSETILANELKQCISMALTYHLTKKQQPEGGHATH